MYDQCLIQFSEGLFPLFRPPKSGGLPSTRLFVDCSTIDPATSLAIASRVHAQPSCSFVDAPMSGGVVGARAGSLTFMLGAPDRLVSSVTTILKHMGGRILHLGPPGAGLAGKLANNYLLAISQIATAEAMNLGIKLGLDGKVLGEMINSSSGRCWASEVNNPVVGVSEGAPCEREFEGGFGVGLMRKDLRLALEAADALGAKIASRQGCSRKCIARSGMPKVKRISGLCIDGWLVEVLVTMAHEIWLHSR